MSFSQEQSVLIISEDLSFCSYISDHLTETGFKVILSHDDDHALEIFRNLHPYAVLTDLKSSKIDGLKILRLIKKQASVPVIIAASASEIGSSLEKIQNYGGDIILKPVKPKLLLKWFNPADFSEKQTTDDNIIVNMVGRIHSANDLDELFETVYAACMQLSDAQYGLLHSYDKESKKLNIVQPLDEKFLISSSVLTGNDEWVIPNWVFFNRKPLDIQLGKAAPEMEADLYRCSAISALSMFFDAGNEIAGIITLFWGDNKKNVTPDIASNLRMVLYQAGVAYNNIVHVATVNQKLDELMLVSTYSEKLMGLVDKYDVIRSLFETSFRYFPIDIVAFLSVQRRSHEFLFWSRGIAEEKTIRDICKETVTRFNDAVKARINDQRVRIRKLPQQELLCENIIKKISFNYVIPVCWEDIKFGAVYFGASKELSNVHEKKAMLMSLVSQTRIALNNSKLYSDMKENYIRTIKALAIAVDAKDTYTHGHSENVMNIAEEIAREMGIDEKGIGIIRDAGLLHDIGKIGIPGYILNKPGPLTYEEFNGIMKTHSTLGANIVKEVPFLYDLHKLILYHHEHYDGGGYPENLRGEQIPVGARILHVADAFEAMTSNRPYRSSLGRKEALKRLIENSGKQFDPIVINAFLRLAAKKGWIEIDESNKIPSKETSV